MSLQECDFQILNNTIDNYCEGIRLYDATATVVNNLMTGCKRGISCDNSSLTENHNGFWDNETNISCGKSPAGEGDLYHNPLYADRANHDYRLMAGSPYIDAGSEEGIDIGAFEFVPSGVVSAPIGLGAEVWGEDGEIRFFWDHATDAGSYEVYYGLASEPGIYDGTDANEGDSPIACYDTSVVLTLSESVQYQLDVTAVDMQDGESAFTFADYATVTPADEIPPAHPTGFTATPGDCRVILAWTNPMTNDWNKTMIRRSTSTYPTQWDEGDSVYCGRWQNRADLGLNNGTKYYYTAFACDEVPNWTDGTCASCTTSAIPVDNISPNNPVFVSADAGDRHVDLTWVNPSDPDWTATRILRHTDSWPDDHNDGAVIYEGVGTDTTDSGLENITMYYYGAFARDEVNNWSPVAGDAQIGAVTGDDADPVWVDGDGLDSLAVRTWTPTGEVRLFWDSAIDSSSVPVFYNVYYDSLWPAENGTKLDSIPVGTCSGSWEMCYTVEGLKYGRTYYFLVRAEDNVGNETDDTDPTRQWSATLEYYTRGVFPESGERYTLEDLVDVSYGAVEPGIDPGDYCMFGNLTVSEYDTLVLGAGETLASTDVTGYKKLLIKGALEADGYPGAGYITLTGIGSTQETRWGGLELQNPGASSHLDALIVEKTRWGVEWSGGNPDLQDCIVRYASSTGLDASCDNAGAITVTGTQVHNCLGDGIECDGPGSSNVMIDNCTVCEVGGTGIGARCDSGGNLQVSMNFALDCRGHGIHCFADSISMAWVGYNEAYNNGGGGIILNLGPGCNASLISNTVYNNLSGLSFAFVDHAPPGFSNDLMVDDNTVYDNTGEGMAVGKTASGTAIMYNSTTGNDIGIDFMEELPDTAGPWVFSNTVTGNVTAGIRCGMGAIPRIDSCLVANNEGPGILSINWGNPTVTRSTVTGNSVGVLVGVDQGPGWADLGNLADSDPNNDGRNRFYDNATYDVECHYPSTMVTLPAEWNWWGTQGTQEMLQCGPAGCEVSTIWDGRDAPGIAEVDYFVFQGASGSGTIPTITLTSPDSAGVSVDNSLTIEWQDEDPEQDATISLYYYPPQEETAPPVLAMHTVAAFEYLSCDDLTDPASPHSPVNCAGIDNGATMDEIVASYGYVTVVFLAYHVDAITGVEYCISGWPTVSPGLEYCPETSSLVGDPFNGGGVQTFGETVEPSEPGGAVVFAWFRWYAFSPYLPLMLDYCASTYTYPGDPHNSVIGPSPDYEYTRVESEHGCTIGADHWELVPYSDCFPVPDGLQQIPGASALSEDDPEDSFTWNTTSADTGTFEIYAAISDGWLTSSGRSPGAVTIGHPFIDVDTTEIAVTLRPDSSKSIPMTVRSVGTYDLGCQFSGQDSSGYDLPWISVIPPSETVSPGDSLVAEVSFNAGGLSRGLYVGDMVVASGDPWRPEILIDLSLDVRAPDLALSASLCAFGAVSLGDTLSLAIQATNAGDDTLNLYTGACATPDYWLDPPVLNWAVPPGDSVALTLHFCPASAGDCSDTLLIHSDDPDTGLLGLPLAGTGMDRLFLSTTSLDFGEVPIFHCGTESLWVVNGDTTSFSLATASVGGMPFMVQGPGVPYALAPGESVAVKVSFCGTILGTYDDVLTLSSDHASPIVAQASLHGDASHPAISLSATALDFGMVALGDTGTADFWTRNTGVGSLVLDSWETSEPLFGIEQPAFPVSMPAGDSSLVRVWFAPSNPDALSATLTMSTNDPYQGTVELGLAGSGPLPDIHVTQMYVHWGQAVAGTDTVFGDVSIVNRGIADLEVLDLSTASDVFTLLTGAPVTVTPEDTLDVELLFHPVSESLYVNVLHVASNDPDAREDTLSVILFGEGVIPEIFLSPDSWTEVVFEGDTLATHLTVINEGSGELDFTISAEVAKGLHPGDASGQGKSLAETKTPDGRHHAQPSETGEKRSSEGASVPWLTIDPDSGAASPGDTVLVTLTVDGSALTPARYDASVRVESNDPDEELIDLPFTVRVPQYRYDHHDAGNVLFCLTDGGCYGYYDMVVHYGFGQGFRYPPASVPDYLWHGSFWAGTGPDRMMDGSCDYDWGTVDELAIGEGVPETGSARFDDSRAPLPLGLSVFQESIARADPPDDDYVVLDFWVTNTRVDVINNLYLGLWMEWNVNQGWGWKDLGGFDHDLNLGYQCHRYPETDSTYVGVSLLAPATPSSFRFIHNPTYWHPPDGIYDADKFALMSSGIIEAAPDSADDWSSLMSVGPVTLVPGDSVHVAFALVAATGLEDLIANTEAAIEWTGILLQSEVVAGGWALYPCYPNPFNPSTTIRFSTGTASHVRLAIYDVRGRLVRALVNEEIDAGYHETWWDGKNSNGNPVPSGVFFCLMNSKEFRQSTKIIVLK
jgi:hypothetical protein